MWKRYKSTLFDFISVSRKQIAFLGPLEWRNLPGQKSKVVNHEKSVKRSAIRFLVLFVLMDPILLSLDLQKMLPAFQLFKIC